MRLGARFKHGRCAMLVPSPGAAAGPRQRFPSHIQLPSILRTTIHFAFLRLHIVRAASRFSISYGNGRSSVIPVSGQAYRSRVDDERPFRQLENPWNMEMPIED
jgi:hypothetical protein